MWQFIVLVEQTSIWSSVQTTSAKWRRTKRPNPAKKEEQINSMKLKGNKWRIWNKMSKKSSQEERANTWNWKEISPEWIWNEMNDGIEIVPFSHSSVDHRNCWKKSWKKFKQSFKKMKKKSRVDLEENEWRNWDRSFFSLVYHPNCANIGKEHYWTRTSTWTTFL